MPQENIKAAALSFEEEASKKSEEMKKQTSFPLDPTANSGPSPSPLISVFPSEPPFNTINQEASSMSAQLEGFGMLEEAP